MLPPWTSLFLHPIAFSRTLIEVIKLNTAHMTAETMERRKKKVEDVAKRAAYRKAHGLENDQSFGGWTVKTDAEVLGPGIPIGDNEEGQPERVVREKRPVKKWLGIW